MARWFLFIKEKCQTNPLKQKKQDVATTLKSFCRLETSKYLIIKLYNTIKWSTLSRTFIVWDTKPVLLSICIYWTLDTMKTIPFAWLQEFSPLSQLGWSSPCNNCKRTEIKMKNQWDCEWKTWAAAEKKNNLIEYFQQTISSLAHCTEPVLKHNKTNLTGEHISYIKNLIFILLCLPFIALYQNHIVSSKAKCCPSFLDGIMTLQQTEV